VELGGTSDTVGSFVYELRSEVAEAFRVLEAKYREVDLNIFVVFRCLPDSIGRKTRRRFDKAENRLYLDMVVSEGRYELLSKEEQRRDLSHAYYDYLADSLRKYRFPGLRLEPFLDDLRTALREIGWLKHAWEIYLCSDPPDGRSGADLCECTCKLCILDPRSVALR